jgi:hypothetical protein
MASDNPGSSSRGDRLGCQQRSSDINRQLFDIEIRAGLAEVSTRRIVEATGLSRSYAARIRGGPAVPHARHWDALRRLAAAPAAGEKDP